MPSENLKFFLINQMQSFAGVLLNTLFDKRFVNESITFPDNNVIASNCMNELLQLSSSALKNENWALKGKLQSGLMSGSLFNSLGDYDQCLSGNDVNSVRGTKYCLASIDLSQESQQLHLLTQQPKGVFEAQGGRLAKLGLCVPDACNTRDITLLANFMVKSSVAQTLSIQQVECSSSQITTGWWPNSFGYWISLLLIVASIAACTSTTILDSAGCSKTSKRSIKYRHMLEIFSLSRAYRRLMLKRQLQGLEGGCRVDLRVLDGLRVISMFWIITIHSYNFGLQWLFFDNIRQVDNIYRSAKVQWLANGTFSVDNFFLISGLLAWLSCIKFNRKHLTPKRKISAESASSKLSSSVIAEEVVYQHTLRTVMLSTCSRYFRLMPIMMIMILFSVNLLPYIAHGPAWIGATTMFDLWCRKNWPINLSMMHNLMNTSNMCFSHSWYVASDFQLFILLQLLLLACSQLPSIRARIVASKWLLAAGIVISQMVVAGIVNLCDLPSVPLVPSDSLQSLNTYYALIYVKPYYWISSYFLGALLAICLTSLEWTAKGREAPRNWQVFLIQLSCLSLMIVLILSTFQHFKEGRRMSRLHSSVYALVARPLWAASIATILLFASLRSRYSSKGRNLLAKSIHSLLSSSLWLPLSRLTYSAYLLHPVIMAMFYGSRTESFQFSHSLLLYFTLGNIVLTYIGALAIHLFIESPIQVFLKRAKVSTGKFYLTNAPTSTLRPSFLGLSYQRPR